MDNVFAHIKTTELKGSTFRSRILDFGDFDISGAEFNITFKKAGNILPFPDFTPQKVGNTLVIPYNILESYSGEIRMEAWITLNGAKDLALVDSMLISAENIAKTDLVNQNVSVTFGDVVIPVTFTQAIVNIGGGTGIGENGKSAYEIAVLNGFTGTESEWLISLKGADGEDFTFEDFTQAQLDSLKGANGTSWTENYSLEEDGARVLRKVTGYFGGTGTLPTELSANIGKYYSKIGGFTTVKADATDFKGAASGSGFEIWSAKIWTVDKIVFHNGKLWKANTNTASTDVPGISIKWTEFLNYSELKNLNTSSVIDSEFKRKSLPNKDIGWQIDSQLLATYTFPTAPTPIGNTAIEVSLFKRSSDNALSKINLRNKSAIPPSMRGRSEISFSFYFKRELKVNLSARLLCYGETGNYLGVRNATVTVLNEVENTWTFAAVNNITLFPNTFSIVPEVGVVIDTTAVLDQIYKVSITGISINYLSPVTVSYIPNSTEIISEFTGRIGVFGKRWTSYGDSITQINVWQPVVVNRLGLIHTNRGIGGTFIVKGTDTKAYVKLDGEFISYTQPAGSEGVDWLYIDSSMSSQNRVDTIPLDTEILTIMGGTNDAGFGLIELGNITDTVNTTFYGAYQLMLDRIRTRLPNVEIILATMIYRNNENTYSANGVTSDMLREAIRKVGYKYGYKVVESKNIGINQANITAYTTDGIHPNTKGGERLSRAFCEVLAQTY